MYEQEFLIISGIILLVILNLINKLSPINILPMSIIFSVYLFIFFNLIISKWQPLSGVLYFILLFIILIPIILLSKSPKGLIINFTTYINLFYGLLYLVNLFVIFNYK